MSKSSKVQDQKNSSDESNEYKESKRNDIKGIGIDQCDAIIDPDQYKMYLRTTQASTMRTLSEALKEVLTDSNIFFSESGLRITSTDNGKKAFVYLKLNAENFQNFHCPKHITIGVNMLSLHKLLKTINNSDIITMFIEKVNENLLGIRIENEEKKTIRTSKLKLIDIDVEPISIPEITFDSVFNISCIDFQKHCRDLLTISENVKIFSKDNSDSTTVREPSFIMHSEGDYAIQTIQVGGASDVSYNPLEDKNAYLIGEYSLKYLNLFCKSSGLCPILEIYLKESFALIIVYSVADLGTIKFGLSPEFVEDMN